MIACAFLAAAIGIRSKQWWMRWFPASAAVAVVAVLGARWYIQSEGMTGEPVPIILWLWVGLLGFALSLIATGWPGTACWRRTIAILAVPLCVVCATLAVNGWVGYARTVRGAWELMTSGPLPNQAELGAVRAMAAAGRVPKHGMIVPVTIGDEASGFKHRREYVYLPPIWFASSPPPPLPVVMMIGGAFGTPADWLRAGDAARTVDTFAAAHGGRAPVLLFPDKGGAFNNDTECVNGPRGNAADHLINDVMPFVRNTFGVRTDAAGAAVVGWSMGGTCAVTLAVKYPTTFATFVSMTGDLGPNVGSRDQTIAKLYGGNEQAYNAFDPTTVMQAHGPYTGMAGLFAVTADAEKTSGGQRGSGDAHVTAAESLCATAQANNIECSIETFDGGHDWPFGAETLRRTMPWIAARVQTPGVPPSGDPP